MDSNLWMKTTQTHLQTDGQRRSERQSCLNSDKHRDNQRQIQTNNVGDRTISDSPREAVETVGRRKMVSAFQQKHPCQDVEEDVRVFAGLPAMFRLYHGPLRGHEKGTGPLSQHQVLAWGLLKAQTHMTKFSSSWLKHQRWRSWTDWIWIFIICCWVINSC